MVKRLICLALVLLLALPLLAACGDGQFDGKDTQSSQVAETVGKAHPDNLPEGLDFGNEEMNILYSTFFGAQHPKTKDVEGDAEGDTVDSAVFARNLYVEERLNVDLVFTCSSETDHTKYAALLDTLYAGQDSTFDVIYHYGLQGVNQSVKGYFKAWNHIPNVDLEADYWFLQQMQDISLNLNTQYLLTGDLLISNYIEMQAIFFNADLLEKLFPERKKSLYQTVYDGEWTWETFFGMVEESYLDNGNTEVDAGDTFGAQHEIFRTYVYYPYGCGLRYTSRDDNGFLTLNYNTPQTGEMVEKLYEFVHATTYTMQMTKEEVTESFLTERMLFFTYQLGNGEGIKKEATFNYGVVPFPKYDSTVDYAVMIANGAGVYCLPVAISSERYEMIGSVMEALCSYNSVKVRPYFYDYILKAKQAGNPEDADMIDFMRAHIGFDPMYWIGENLGNCNMVFREVIKDNNSSNFSGHWGSKGFVYETMLQIIIGEYQKFNTPTAR